MVAASEDEPRNPNFASQLRSANGFATSLHEFEIRNFCKSWGQGLRNWLRSLFHCSLTNHPCRPGNSQARYGKQRQYRHENAIVHGTLDLDIASGDSTGCHVHCSSEQYGHY